MRILQQILSNIQLLYFRLKRQNIVDTYRPQDDCIVIGLYIEQPNGDVESAVDILYETNGTLFRLICTGTATIETQRTPLCCFDWYEYTGETHAIKRDILEKVTKIASCELPKKHAFTWRYDDHGKGYAVLHPIQTPYFQTLLQDAHFWLDEKSGLLGKPITGIFKRIIYAHV